MESLPVELLLAILAELPASDILRLAQVSSFFSTLIRDPSVWSMKACHDYAFPRNLFSTFTDSLTGTQLTDPRRRYFRICQYETNWFPAIAKAADQGNLELVKYLVARRARQLSDQRINLKPALARAAYQGHQEIVQFLINSEYTAQSTLTRGSGSIRLRHLKWALSEAARGGHMDIIKYLMQFPDQNVIDTRPIRTCLIRPLNQAARQGNLDLVRWFVDCGIINLDSALCRAARGGHIPVMDYLIQQGALDFNLALEQACLGGHLDAVKLILAQGTSHPWALDYAVRQGHQKIVQYLLDHHYPNWFYRVLTTADRAGRLDEFTSLVNPRPNHHELEDLVRLAARRGRLNLINMALIMGRQKMIYHELS